MTIKEHKSYKLLEQTVYAGEVYSKSLKRNMMLVHATYLKATGKDTHKLYFCTDVDMEPKDVQLYYHSQFQIEFLYRDEKQTTGLNDSQARVKTNCTFSSTHH